MKKFFTVSLLSLIIMFVFNISEATTINNKNKWNLYFENINITEGSVNAITEPTITDSSKTEITYSVNLNVPGDFYEFTVDVKNDGTLDAMVSEINGNQLTETQKKFLLFEVTYLDGTEVKQNDKLKSGKTETLRIRLEFKKDITAEDLPSETATLTLSVNTCYVQADDKAQERESEVSDDNEKDDSNNENKNDIGEGLKEKEEEINSIKTSKNSKTGDNIIKYIITLVLAILALVITKIINDKGNR